jgi:hypothetical protein
MGFRYELRTPDGDDMGTFESSVSNWQPGEGFRDEGNVRYRITGVIPAALIEEFVDRRSMTDCGRSSRIRRRRSTFDQSFRVAPGSARHVQTWHVWHV